MNSDQKKRKIRPPIRHDQTRPDPTRPDQTRADHSTRDYLCARLVSAVACPLLAWPLTESIPRLGARWGCADVRLLA